MSFLTDGYKVVLGDDDSYFDDEEETEEDEELEPKQKNKKAKGSAHDDEEDDDEDIIICPVCGEEVIASEDELFEGARIVCDSGSGCMAELEVIGFDKENHPRLKVVEDEK